MPRRALLLLAFPLLAQTPYSIPPADAPELARRGPFSVGVRTLELVHPAQPDILRLDKATNQAPLADRPLTVEIWYPAQLNGQPERTTYPSILPGAAAKPFQVPGAAARDAAPVAGQRFPLVVASHGYPGSRSFLSWITENLASKGYVVASIDHTDSVFGAVRAFPSTLLNRTQDQRFVLDELVRLAATPGHFLSLLDPERTAILGYSMGGYGALSTAGAPYSPRAAANAMVGPAFKPLTEPASPRPNLKAAIFIAPWGTQPPHNSFNPEGLAAIKIPSLWIAGDQDDISMFSTGIRPAFEKTVHSPRCLLVFENANHNVGGNPPPPEALGDFSSVAFFEEPVWRKDRIAAINQHFITAFLDLHVKGDQTRRSYLEVPTPRSNDGKWPRPGQPGAFAPAAAGQSEITVWQGFQRRWAFGLQLHCAPAQP